MHLSLIQFVMVHRDRAYRMVGDPSDKHSDYDAAAKVIVCTDPYPYTVAGASVALSIYWPGPDEAKVQNSPLSIWGSSSNRPSSIIASRTRPSRGSIYL